MRKFYICASLLLSLGALKAGAQNLYSINNGWLDLDTYKKCDTAASADNDFKHSGKYACRFVVPGNMTTALKEVTFKGRTFRVADDNHIGMKAPNSEREVLVDCNSGNNKYDIVPGNNFFIPVSDGVVYIQRFDAETGYRITKYDEYGHVRMKQAFPHTKVVEKGGTEFKQPYLTYLGTTDRYLVFTSLVSHDIHKTIVVDLKDGKANPLESSVCGIIRSSDEKSIAGYLMKDEKAKALTVSSSMGKWSIKENNPSKLATEALLNDSVLVMARYYKSAPGISLVAFHVKTGKVLWIADVKKPTAGQEYIFLSMYKNNLLMEGNDTNGNYLQAFDMATGKRTYSSI